MNPHTIIEQNFPSFICVARIVRNWLVAELLICITLQALEKMTEHFAQMQALSEQVCMYSILIIFTLFIKQNYSIIQM